LLDSVLESERNEFLDISKKLSKIHILLSVKIHEEFEEFRSLRRDNDDPHEIDINSFKNPRKPSTTSGKNEKGFLLSSNVNHGTGTINVIQSNFVSKFRV
jgi:hypothetical protein